MPTRSRSSTARVCAADRDSDGLWMRTASAIWSPTRKMGVSAVNGSWEIIATERPRSVDISRSASPSSCRPFSSIDPDTRADGGSRPITASDDTDLPDPDSPTMASTSPRVTE